MYALKTFQAILEDIQVRAEAHVQGNQLVFDFALRDPASEVKDLGVQVMHGEHGTWVRADELWKTTCFEAFVGFTGDPGYWEFNFSLLKRSWNVYRFQGYRSPQPPRATMDFEMASANVTKENFKFVVDSKVSLKAMECGLTAVIRTAQSVHYFALTHASDKPDFHKRESFSKRF